MCTIKFVLIQPVEESSWHKISVQGFGRFCQEWALHLTPVTAIGLWAFWYYWLSSVSVQLLLPPSRQVNISSGTKPSCDLSLDTEKEMVRGIAPRKQGPEGQKMLRIRAAMLSWMVQAKATREKQEHVFYRPTTSDGSWGLISWTHEMSGTTGAGEGLTQPPGQRGWKCQGWPAAAVWVTQRQQRHLGNAEAFKQFPNLWAATLLCQVIKEREASSPGMATFLFSWFSFSSSFSCLCSDM